MSRYRVVLHQNRPEDFPWLMHGALCVLSVGCWIPIMLLHWVFWSVRE